MPRELAVDPLKKFYSFKHMQKDSGLEFSVFERTNKAHRMAVNRALAEKWAQESTQHKMIKAKELA